QGSTDGSSSEVVQDASGDVRPRGDSRGSGDRESVRVGEVVLDSSEIPLGDDGETTGLTRVEVEVREENASDSGVREFVKAMEGALGLRPAKISKYEAGIFATGLSPSEATGLGSENIDGTLSTGEMAFAVLRRQFAAMRAHEAGTRLGEDPEELHDMRVATRRMRAALRLFEDALPERARWLQEELRWIGGSLGEVRDPDVQIEQLERWAVGAGEEGAEAFAEIIAAVKERREEARKRMLDTLNSGRYARFEGSFAEMLRRGPDHERDFGQVSANGSGMDPADEPVLISAPSLLSRRYRKWSKAANRLNDSSDPEGYHDLRKKGKRLRYALEFFTDVYGEKATGALIKPLKSIQDSLGDHQDAIVASDRLREIVADSPKLPPQTAFIMGSLAQRHVQEAAGLRAGLAGTKAYRALTKGKTWKDFEKLTDKERATAEKAESKGAESSSKPKASKAKAGKDKKKGK
ncbi:MAG TPA: CHAD domain-containing protein, partial [Rubrobacter sp.]|nr:CHAD domain-containing protein [Rubrobacter sp.]